ncbi:MAG: protein kinase, partial [Candidatus Schekmanbacteria bacterium]|nr:protein kinase [Candidatus Schekmanbacteria bacterium]
GAGGAGCHATLMDLGIVAELPASHLWSSMRQTGKSEMFGTPGAMAVEQSRRAIDAVPRSDIFSLGCVLYELWCGAAAFPVRTFDASGRAEQAQPARWPSEIVAPFPAELEAVLRECFALAPEARPFPGVLGARLAAWAELDAERDRLFPPAAISYLDLPATRLVGREDELAEIAKAAWAVCRPGHAGPRLGLVGPAGSGKHRLATEARVAWERASLLVVRLRLDRIAAGAVAEELVARVRRAHPGAELAGEGIAALDAGAAETVARALAPTWESASALILERLDAASDATRAFVAALLARFAGVALVTAESEDALVGLGAPVRRLEALAAAPAAELCRAVLGGPLAAGAEELMAAAPRLPGTLIDWLGEQVAAGRLRRGYDGTWEVGSEFEVSSFALEVSGGPSSAPCADLPASGSEVTLETLSTPPVGPPFHLAARTRALEGPALNAQPKARNPQFDTRNPQPETRSSLSPDELLARGHIGSCRLLSFIGQGGMGMVFRGELDGRQVAVKVTRMAGERAAGRFREEMRALSAFAHPHIVRMLDVVHDEELGMVGLVMEYLPRTLTQASRVGLDAETAIRVGWQLAQALDFVTTTMAAAHRDLKPDNVMLTTDGTVRLTDFGLLGSLTAAAAGGTPAYMAPEVLARHLGRERATLVDARADIYSFAWLIHEVFAGITPLPVASLPDCARRMDEDPPMVSEGIPARLRSLLRRCLDRDPTIRPRSFAEVCAEWNPDAIYPDLETARWRLAWAYVGRRELQRQVGALVEDSAGPRLVLVWGGRGAGKTRFLRELASELRTAGRNVVSMAAGDLGDVFAAAAGSACAESVLLVDDLEAWAAARDALEWAEWGRARIVATTSAPRSVRIARDEARTIELAPLGVAETQELLARVFGDVYDAERTAATLFVAAGGTPQLLIALLGELIAAGAALSMPTLRWRIEARQIERILAAPALAELAAAYRVPRGELSSDAAAAYGAIWLGGVWLPPAGIAATLGWSNERAAVALDALGRHVLRDADGRVRPANALARPDWPATPADLDVGALAQAVRSEDRSRALRLLLEAGSHRAVAFGMALVEELSQEDAHRDLITAMEMIGRPIGNERAWFSCLICYLQALRCMPEQEMREQRFREVTQAAIDLAAGLRDPGLEARAYAARSMTRLFPMAERRADAERALALADACADRRDAYVEACIAIAHLSKGDNFDDAVISLLDRMEEVTFEALGSYTRKILLSTLVTANDALLPLPLRLRRSDYAQISLDRHKHRPDLAINIYAGLIQANLSTGANTLRQYEMVSAALAQMPASHPYFLPASSHLVEAAAELGLLTEAIRHTQRVERYCSGVDNLAMMLCQQAELARLSGRLGPAFHALDRAARYAHRLSPTVRGNLELTRCDVLVDAGGELSDTDLPRLDEEEERIFADCTRIRYRLLRHDFDGAGEILSSRLRETPFAGTEERLGLYMLALRHAVHTADAARAFALAELLAEIGPRRAVERDMLLGYFKRDEAALRSALGEVGKMTLAPVEMDILCKLVWCAGCHEHEQRFWALLEESADGLATALAAAFRKRWERDMAWHARHCWH